MKFINSLLTFTLIITTTSLVQSYSFKNPLNIRGFLKCADALSNLDENCGLDIDDIDEKNVEKFCTLFNSEQCYNLHVEGLRGIPECKDAIPDLLSDIEKEIVHDITTRNIYCMKDESNQYCPMSVIEIKNENLNNQEKYMDIMKETCKSKKCTEDALAYFKNKIESKGIFGISITKGYSLKEEMDGDILNELSTYLKSEECTSQYGNYTNGYEMSNISTGKSDNKSQTYRVTYSSDAVTLKKSFAGLLITYLLLNIF